MVKLTKSGKEILSKKEFIADEKEEAQDARKNYRKQRWQYRKSLYYLPLVFRVVVALAIASAICYLSFRYGVETVEGTEPTIKMNKSIVILRTAPCRLPTTGVE